MIQIVEGRKIAGGILATLKERVIQYKRYGIKPALAVVIVGNDPASHIYVKHKKEAAEKIGIAFFKFEFPPNITKFDLISQIKKIQRQIKLSGLIIQLPLPATLQVYKREIIEVIEPEIDVDCLTTLNQGKIVTGQWRLTNLADDFKLASLLTKSILIPPTPAAILEILKFYKIKLSGKKIVIIGRGELIGRPLVNLLMNLPVTLMVAGRATADLEQLTLSADIIISGTGKAGLITGKMVKPGAIVIDGGISFIDGKMSGDIDFSTVAEKASLITPVPGGVGPVTVAKLLANVVINTEKLYQKRFPIE